MGPCPIPATLIPSNHRSLVTEILAEQMAMVDTFRQATSLDVATLDHPAARRLHGFHGELSGVGFALYTDAAPVLSARGLLDWVRQVRGAWTALLRAVPSALAQAVTESRPLPPAEVRRRLQAPTLPVRAALGARRIWRPRELPLQGSIDAFLRTLTPGLLRQTADYTSHQTEGTASTLRRACRDVLDDPQGCKAQVHAAPGAALLLLRTLLAVPRPTPICQLSDTWGALLQDRPRDLHSAVGWLQRLGLAYAGIDRTSGALVLDIPRSLREVLQTYLPPLRPDLPGLELDVHIHGIQPPVWRRIRLRGDATLADLHHAIQDAFGWENTHLFEFLSDDDHRTHLGGIPSSPTGDPLLEEETLDAWIQPVRAVLRSEDATLSYLYDFGDEWDHRVRLASVLPRPLRFHRQLVGGARSGPLEDCGGAIGYADCVAVFRGTRRDLALSEWMGTWDPERFELEAHQEFFDL